MASFNDSDLLNGGDSVGMTDNQYKGILLDQLKSWKRVFNQAITDGNTKIQEMAKEEIETIEEKLKF